MDPIFTKGPPRAADELIRFSAYMVNFQGNDMGKYGKILTFSTIAGKVLEGFAPNFYQVTL